MIRQVTPYYTITWLFFFVTISQEPSKDEVHSTTNKLALICFANKSLHPNL